MSTGPRILATDGSKFRIVELSNGTKVLEKADGCDALGVERWRTVDLGSSDTISRWMRDWIITHALTCEQFKEMKDAEL